MLNVNHPHRKPNWPSLVITILLLAAVVTVFLAYAQPAYEGVRAGFGG